VGAWLTSGFLLEPDQSGESSASSGAEVLRGIAIDRRGFAQINP